MTHLCFETKMSLRWTGWRRRLLLGCHNVKYVLIVSERNTGIHLNPEAVVTCEGGRCTAVQRNDQFCSTRGSQSQKFYFCIQAVLIITYFLLGFSLVTNKAILLNTTNSVENCSSHVIPSGLERNYLSIKWKKEKTTPKAFFVFISKAGYNLCKLILTSWTLKFSTDLDNHLLWKKRELLLCDYKHILQQF